MALGKEIILENGVPTNYHRVTLLTIVTNVQNIIEVASYTSEEKRKEEQEAIAGGAEHNIFIHTEIISTPYEQDMTIESSYEYLKTLPIFEGAEDI